MSTHNGQDYVSETLSKIKNQLEACVHLLIRDDGSKDRTLVYLNQISAKMEIVQGTNVGSNASYFELFKLAKTTDFNYFALCDQDDHWDSNHLKISMDKLDKKTSVVFSNCKVIKKNRVLRFEHFKHVQIISPFFEHPYHGSGYVFSREVINILSKLNPRNVIQHDFAIYIVGFLTKSLVFQEVKTWNYNLHDRNERGIRTFRKTVNTLLGINGFVALRIKQANHIIDALKSDTYQHRNIRNIDTMIPSNTTYAGKRKLVRFSSLENLFLLIYLRLYFIFNSGFDKK